MTLGTTNTSADGSVCVIVVIVAGAVIATHSSVETLTGVTIGTTTVVAYNRTDVIIDTIGTIVRGAAGAGDAGTATSCHCYG